MTQQLGKSTLERVEISPLVLLSVADHYNRTAKDTKKRVIGCLLGSRFQNVLTVSNCFAVPFDEEEKSLDTWFLDYNYLEDMAHMFKRVNANEKVVGWYSTGPKLKKNDIEIHKLFYRYNVEPTLAVIQVRELTEDLPTKSYVAVDVVQSDGRHEKEFAHVMSAVVASEAEEVGVEHLLREIQDISLSTLTTEVNRKMTGLHGLVERLSTIRDYLEKVATERLPINQDILTNLQLIFNLLPNLSKIQLIQSFSVKKNDMMLNIYVASLLRSILALDQLLENRLQNKLREDKKEKDEQNGKKKEKEKEKEKEKDKDKDKDKDKEKDENKTENKKTEKDDRNK